MTDHDHDYYNLVVPFVDFVARFGMYPDAVRQRFREYVAFGRHGLSAREIAATAALLNAIDEENN